jgi:hypothetical protein
MLIIIGAVLIGLYIIYFITILILSNFGLFSEKALLPEITRGEFPFRLVYEINGEEIVVEDTIICEFDGVGYNKGVGNYRRWRSYLASNKKTHGTSARLLIDETNSIYVTLGSAHYFMGEEGRYVPYTLNFHAFLVQRRLFDGENLTAISEDELLENYGIKLISFDPSLPIVNTFR